MSKFQNKYRIESTRLQSWNYAWDAAYFITICTKDRSHFFGRVVDDKMELSKVGIIANVLWHEIKNHAKNIQLGEFVVMPNHIHGIIIIGETRHALSQRSSTPSPDDPRSSTPSPDDPRSSTPSPDDPRSSTPSPDGPEAPRPEKTVGQQRFQNQGKNTISSIVGSYKSAVTKHCNRLHLGFGWQPSFHDHVIRDQRAFDNISEYIRKNIINWKEDKFHH